MMANDADGRKLMIAVDDSDVCERAVKWALEHLYRKGDQMHLVHIIPRMQLAAVYGAPPVDFLPQQDPVAYEQLVAEAERFVAARFLTLLQGLQPEPVAHIIKSEVDTDSIGNVLCKKAQDLHAVAIVMASHSKSSLQQFFLGRWQDGQRFERQLVNNFDRWDVHCADVVTVCADEISVVIRQQPRSLQSDAVGVGACLWASSLHVAKYLLELPRHQLVGARCVELGAGVGLLGILCARLGAQIVLTDQASVLPLLRQNIAENLPSIRAGGGQADVRELVWGTPEGTRVGSALARPALDLVIAADCVYEGADIEALIAMCRLLCSSTSRCLVAVEKRTSEAFERFLKQAGVAFGKVTTVLYTSQIGSANQVQLIDMSCPLAA